LIRVGAGRILGISASPRGKEGDDVADGAVVSLGELLGDDRGGVLPTDRRVESAVALRLVAGLTADREDWTAAHGGGARATAALSASGVDGVDHAHRLRVRGKGSGMSDDDTVGSLGEEQRGRRSGPLFRRSSGRRLIVSECGDLSWSGWWSPRRRMWRFAVVRRRRLRLGV
jgi:hypothetical protein